MARSEFSRDGAVMGGGESVRTKWRKKLGLGEGEIVYRNLWRSEGGEGEIRNDDVMKVGREGKDMDFMGVGG